MTESTPEHHHPDYQALQRKADEYLDGWKRAKADYLNYKKEVEQQREELAQFATIAMVLDILPLHAHFKRAVLHIPEAERNTDWVKGILAIYKQLEDMLSNLNIKEVETTHFDPAKHEAVEYKEAEGRKEGEIIDVVEYGYEMHGRIIQPAKVVVASGLNKEKGKSNDHSEQHMNSNETPNPPDQSPGPGDKKGGGE